MVKKETEKKAAEKPVKPAKEKVVKERVERYAPGNDTLENIAKELGLRHHRTGHRTTLWTDTGIRVVKVAGSSITLVQPEKKTIHPANGKELRDAIAGVLDVAKNKQRHVPTPPKREKKAKSPEEKEKAKLVKKAAPEEPKVKKAAAPPKPAAPVKKPAPKSE